VLPAAVTRKSSLVIIDKRQLIFLLKKLSLRGIEVPGLKRTSISNAMH
jgi:hypothetical protein